jgi:hypothetical protein
MTYENIGTVHLDMGAATRSALWSARGVPDSSQAYAGSRSSRSRTATAAPRS